MRQTMKVIMNLMMRILLIHSKYMKKVKIKRKKMVKRKNLKTLKNLKILINI